MTETFTRTLGALNDRINELEDARDHLSGLLQGLKKMHPKDVAVPGVDACECVAMVTGDEA